MDIISWNVNGIRAALKKGFVDFVKLENPDILCLQETKANKEQVQLHLEGYRQYWNSAEKKGYSGTAIFTKKEPISVSYDIPGHDKEGRVITLEFDDWYLVDVYTPNSQRGLTRLAYRQEWDKDFLKYVKGLEAKKPVIFCGDLNVAHEEIDLKNPGPNKRNAGFTDEEREDFSKILDSGFIDTFRKFYPQKIQYTWWSYMFNARAKGIGWRIDYFVISGSLQNIVKDSQILDDVMGSDHCPIRLII